jgi:hypothetical protein
MYLVWDLGRLGDVWTMLTDPLTALYIDPLTITLGGEPCIYY